MMISAVQKRGSVAFPDHTGERVYMLPFQPAAGLPRSLARWQPTVDAMMAGINAPVAYLMIDQGIVKPSHSHRRGGVHIDGKWNPELKAWGPVPGPGHSTGGHITNGSFVEGLLLASNVTASRAFAGGFNGDIGEGGDCSHIDLSGLAEIPLEAGYCYAGNITMLHESLPIETEALRTLVRINVPGWHPEVH